MFIWQIELPNKTTQIWFVVQSPQLNIRTLHGWIVQPMDYRDL